MGQGPSAPWQGGPAWAVAALGLPWPLPLHHLQPARQAQSRTLGTALREGHLAPPAVHRCSHFALSSAVCVLCGRADVNPDTFGRIFDQIWFWVHEFCLIFANISFDKGPTEEGTVGIDLAVLARTVKQANQKQCCVCGERGAAIACAESGCARSFHLPCAKDGQCITQFFGQHR
ncbi:PHD finger protein 7-like isoform X2 [Meleagris gallopavo]|uniref:PHD finger protein 7-like isoform X2 n=1 Tax=Meleagris gallopavo TaxID=9103 RepID=UPI00093E676A|nr:PHD finger protein 7-like isoform X2 [Meleagris gallopavo]